MWIEIEVFYFSYFSYKLRRKWNFRARTLWQPESCRMWSIRSWSVRMQTCTHCCAACSIEFYRLFAYGQPGKVVAYEVVGKESSFSNKLYYTSYSTMLRCNYFSKLSFFFVICSLNEFFLDAKWLEQFPWSSFQRQHPVLPRQHSTNFRPHFLWQGKLFRC